MNKETLAITKGNLVGKSYGGSIRLLLSTYAMLDLGGIAQP